MMANKILLWVDMYFYNALSSIPSDPLGQWNWMDTMNTNTHLYNLDFVDEIYDVYQHDPSQVSEKWRAYFGQLETEQAPEPVAAAQASQHKAILQHFTNYKPQKTIHASLDSDTLRDFAKKQAAVLRLINAYRFRGHQRAKLDPLEQYERPEVVDLHPETYGLSAGDMDTVFDTGSLRGIKDQAKLRDIIHHVKATYCSTLGMEYMHITDTQQKRWIQDRIETMQAKPNFDSDQKRLLLEHLTAAQGLEDYLHTKYVGQKRFSLEGCESVIPALDELIQESGRTGVKEIVIGMAHRGRLNVLVNILGKRPRDLFSEFEGKADPKSGSGDVKYHQGFSSDVMTPGGPVHLALAFNPSHLEIINPVVEGSVRARQDRLQDKKRNQVLPILVHGDAAFAGQGVVMETLNLSQTRGYSTGGTVHLIVNNQIGFTTSDPLDSRSTLYCTDVAKMMQVPIFHVNGDDPEMVLFATKLALEYRMAYNKDAVVDIVCYRRHGHNEADEPALTQPAMYQKIAQHTKTQALYAQQLVKENVIEAEDGELFLQQYRAALKTKEVVSRPVSLDFKHAINWRPFIGTHWTNQVNTVVSASTVQRLGHALSSVPSDFTPHRTLSKLLINRQKMSDGETPFDWGMAENLAYATLLEEGYAVRISGQDCGRGTFAHRHAVLHDKDNGDTYLPLQHLSDNQAPFLVINSLLSEEAVLAFEFGYSSSDPNTLTVWEAQFGDFANGAQVVFDQFISSCESKWQRLSGLVVLLPHGYDGQGPEHSSARLERYLQLCAEDNIQVCVPTTPAQCFHMLRRQMLRPYRKPLIVMSPKSLLRHKRAVSEVRDFTENGFQVVIDETDSNINPEQVTRLLFCSGKVYYDLLEAREQYNITDIAIVRLEQLYPYPREAVAQVLERYPNVESRVWVQEEPRNQGAWWYMRAHMDVRLSMAGAKMEYAGRPASASPAVGYLKVHRQQLQDLLNEALLLDRYVSEQQQTA